MKKLNNLKNDINKDINIEEFSPSTNNSPIKSPNKIEEENINIPKKSSLKKIRLNNKGENFLIPLPTFFEKKIEFKKEKNSSNCNKIIIENNLPFISKNEFNDRQFILLEGSGICEINLQKFDFNQISNNEHRKIFIKKNLEIKIL